MDWINSAVDEFCRISGVVSDFSASAIVQLSFEQRGLLNIEVVQEHLVLFLIRDLEWHHRSEAQVKALRLCHIGQGWPYMVRSGMLGQESLVLSASIPVKDVTLPMIEQAFGLLSRLHDEIEAR
ncbi:type III secretion chaperone SycN [Shewanella psychrophila]|uniref:Type III secretion chaperone SycN n=1 Tax=Shewanella psychrophila TaxID=225848 RepID=A0A1S6HYP7_9GAMM|nr:type III secretion chaperone SycN [Shewanella psychrophila]AQS40631.1 type III secretion chaperone SycN [Shewanella psychrophila]